MSDKQTGLSEWLAHRIFYVPTIFNSGHYVTLSLLRQPSRKNIGDETGQER